MQIASRAGTVVRAIAALTFAVAPLGAGAHAAEAKDADWPALQGTWVVAAAEQGGKPFDDIKGGRLTITERAFTLVTATGNRLAGDLAIDAVAKPKSLDFVLAGGERWLAIYSVSGTALRLNYVEAADGAPRPTRFATASGQSGTVISLKKEAP